MAELNIVELVGSIKERLTKAGALGQFMVAPPFSEDVIDRFREYFAPRHLPDELVEFWRAGPVSPVGVATDPMGIGDDENDQSALKRLRETGGLPSHLWPASSRWVELGTEGEFIFYATAPEARQTGAVLLWDASGPGNTEPFFPSLGSLLWFWNELAARLEDGRIEFHRVGYFVDWFWPLVLPAANDDPIYKELWQAAVRIGGEHDGWVWDQPLPQQSGTWTLEWLTALGVGDLDMP